MEETKVSSVSSKNKEDVSPEPTKYYKLGDPIAPPPVPGSRAPATGFEIGMFGAGTGKFAAGAQNKGGQHPSINDKNTDQSPGINRRKKEVLGDFTMFRLNKEFENF